MNTWLQTSVVSVAAIMLAVCMAISVVPARGQVEALRDRVDVIVYGATPAGIMASVAAAREGASVLLVEPSGHVGGMVTGGLGATDHGNTQTIGGDTRRFFEAIGMHYATTLPDEPQWAKGWRHEPHVAARVFDQMMRDAGVMLLTKSRLKEKNGVGKVGGRIEWIEIESGERLSARVFIDASYEGDLMAQAGVGYTWGRESVGTYNEERAGIRPPVKFGRPGSARDAQGLIPYVVEPHGELGEADRRVMSYTFRLCMTRNPENRIPFTKPHDYDVRRYELVLQELAAKPDAEFGDYVRLNPLPNGKVDANNRPGVIVSTNLPNGSWDYPDGTYARRTEIWKAHETWVRGFIWFLQTDPRVSEKIRSEAIEWGLAADEFEEYGGWSPQLYVRVARRMIGEHVTTAHDLTTNPIKPDPVGMGSYFLDSHRVSRLVLPDGDVATEGGVGGSTVPYQISYRSLIPKRGECENLLVPVCLSTSAVALCSIRMEPVYMILGQSAGTAAGLAAKTDRAVQDIPFAELESRLRRDGQVLEVKPSKEAKSDAVGRSEAGETVVLTQQGLPAPIAPAPIPPAPIAPAPIDAAPAQAGQTSSPLLPGIKIPPAESPEAPGFFPAFDRYGQYVHRDWPGKIRSDEQLRATVADEMADLQKHPGPEDWNEYGGWASGPQLDSTGFFRTTKYGNRFWLVDPSGKLFFSVGVNCVRKMDPTPIQGREHFFTENPLLDPSMSAFEVRGVSAIKAALAGTQPISFNFTWANLARKYGESWDETTRELSHQRLRSWGFNTIGNWSDERTYLKRRTPYVVNLRVIAPGLKVPSGGIKDPFDPALGPAVKAALAAEASNGDPWNIGYFVDNEIPWSTPGSVGVAALKAPANQPAKIELARRLEEKYTTIEALNAAWKSSYASWEALLDSTDVPEQASADLEDFRLHFADVLYRNIKQAFVESGTPHLYLGSRIHGRQDAIIAIAARHCDVVSVNGYRDHVNLYPVVDRPMMITEFSFGATDRGMFYAGMNNARTQQGRAEKFSAFVESVMNHPNFVGYHWFQFTDQPASGRTREGENGNYGLVDITDAPAMELIEATRAAGARLYERLRVSSATENHPRRNP